MPQPLRCKRCNKFIGFGEMFAGKTLYRFNFETEKDEHLCAKCTTIALKPKSRTLDASSSRRSNQP